MPSAVAPNPHAPAPDDLDALFNFDAGIDEAAQSRGAEQISKTNTSLRPSDQTIQANLDEEIIITKKRTPIAKLDEDRILSATGIPRLRKISKSMRYKGKGHEFSDMARMLNMYQLWLDDMYPRAKFADGLSIVEKLGHKKKIQMYRREWIDEGRPKVTVEAGDEEPAEPTNGVDNTIDAAPATTADVPPRTTTGDGDTEDATSTTMSGALPISDSRSDGPGQQGDQPPDDELDALMAEDAEASFGRPHSRAPDSFAEEEEVMAEMGW